ncbi:MAG: hypothetical protein H0X33_12135 [Taibaiella sp.]|nr:hypothetical protein [Taibaiella sp.]
MKSLFFLLFLFCSCVARAQNVAYKYDLIYLNNKPYAYFKKEIRRDHYSIQSLHNHDLVNIHAARIMMKGRMGYVVQFSGSGKQAMIFDNADPIKAAIRLFYQCNLIVNDTLNTQAETLFLQKHALPKGYLDIDDLQEYGYLFDRMGKELLPSHIVLNPINKSSTDNLFYF